MFDIFETLYWSGIVNAVSRLPKEVIGAGILAGTVLEIHRRNTNVKIAETEAKVRVAEAEVEALKLKKQIQETEIFRSPE